MSSVFGNTYLRVTVQFDEECEVKSRTCLTDGPWTYACESQQQKINPTLKDSFINSRTDLWPPFSGFLDLTHTHTHIVYIHAVGLLWTSDQPVAETSTYTGQHNI
jgi:hypothetical protein